MSISIAHLTKNYGSQQAVAGISFSVGKAEIAGFLGPNGAGKSTTMKMITGYLLPDGGNINVCGLDAIREPLEVKKKIGYLPEANPLYLDMYVREYLNFIAQVHGIKDVKTQVEKAIHTVGLQPEAHKKAGQLSKGYKQRVGLAAALVHDPEVLILDEPTSGLDPNQIVEIRQVIRDLAKTKTVLFSSHIMQEVEALCDRVIIINKGSIVADDRLQNLQRGSGHQAVTVEFSEAISVELLHRLQGVISIEPMALSSFSIQCSNAEMLKKDLLSLSINHRLDIVSLRDSSQNLESVFKSLTT